MGMFDEIIVHVPLPDIGMTDELFQTKDFDFPELELYEITTEGRLIKNEWDWEGDTERGFGIRHIPGSHRIIDQNFHGILNFYSNREKWFEYNAKFANGKLETIERER